MFSETEATRNQIQIKTDPDHQSLNIPKCEKSEEHQFEMQP